LRFPQVPGLPLTTMPGVADGNLVHERAGSGDGRRESAFSCRRGRTGRILAGFTPRVPLSTHRGRFEGLRGPPATPPQPVLQEVALRRTRRTLADRRGAAIVACVSALAVKGARVVADRSG
jgi:hypothetical protein